MSSAVASNARNLVLHKTVQSIRHVRKGLDPRATVGFVPTMGALHEGHLSLVREARASNDVVIASVFVNPTQFGPSEDLDKYPRQLERDSDLLAELGVDHLFAPDSASMYGKNHVTFVVPEGFDDIAEGRARPGHFKGVATIVTKLLNIVQPTNAYFGQKDAAQCVLIRRIVEDLNLDVNCVVMDTVRENDGLAMSSRNAYLSPQERAAAPVVYRALCAAKALFEELDSHSDLPAETLRQTVHDVLKRESLVREIQYVSVDSKATMKPLDMVTKLDGVIISLACKVGSVRLIDNIVL